MPRPALKKGDKVWWTSGMLDNIVNYGILHTTRPPQFLTNVPAAATWVHVFQYDKFMRPSRLQYIAKTRLNTFEPMGLSKLNEAIKLINIGRLQYNQHFFRSPKHKKTEWRKGYERYKKLCREYNVPVNPKRYMPDLPESR